MDIPHSSGRVGSTERVCRQGLSLGRPWAWGSLLARLHHSLCHYCQGIEAIAYLGVGGRERWQAGATRVVQGRWRIDGRRQWANQNGVDRGQICGYNLADKGVGYGLGDPLRRVYTHAER